MIQVGLIFCVFRFISRFCTSIVAQDKDGNVFHGRNMDIGYPILRNLTIDLVFLKNGKVYVYYRYMLSLGYNTDDVSKSEHQ